MRVTLQDRIGVIETNLDDLQSGIEAESRAVGGVHDDALKVRQLLDHEIATARLVGSLVNKTRELRLCLKDQRAALQELRENMRQLNEEMSELLNASRKPQI